MTLRVKDVLHALKDCHPDMPVKAEFTEGTTLHQDLKLTYIDVFPTKIVIEVVK